jgi:hypothetical protein
VSREFAGEEQERLGQQEAKEKEEEEEQEQEQPPEASFDKSDFLQWVRLSEEILGSSLVAHLPDEKVLELVSNRGGWIGLPLPGEFDKEEIENRPDPHIDLKLRSNTIRIGMRCNTVKSIEKLANILEAAHSREKEELIAHMKRLDDDFATEVYSKIKERNFGERELSETRMLRDVWGGYFGCSRRVLEVAAQSDWTSGHGQVSTHLPPFQIAASPWISSKYACQQLLVCS